MEVNANIVRELREKTGAGVMDCKKALAESKGDLEKATVGCVERHRVGCQARGRRRLGRLGRFLYSCGRQARGLVEVNCQTDRRQGRGFPDPGERHRDADRRD